MNSILQIREVALEVEGKILLQDFSLDVRKGEKIALKGRSGSGKTSLLKSIIGFFDIANGEILFNGSELSENNISSKRLDISWLPQNVAAIGDGEVSKWLSDIFSLLANRNLRVDENLIFDAMERLNLDKALYHSEFAELSGGEKQRFGLLVCKLLDRPLALLDEPSSALDKSSVELAAEYILKDAKATVISASHDEKWLAYNDRIIEL